MIEPLILEIRKAFEAEGNSTNAEAMSAYMKGKFAYFGLKSPDRRSIQTPWLKKVKQHKIDHWDLIFNLVNQTEREFFYVAIDYLNKIPKKEIQLDDWRKIESLILHHSWWDTVDLIASNYLGNYFKKFPEQIDSVTNEWRKHTSFWLHRSCLIFQLKYKENVDFELLKSFILQFSPNKEFFIQKAIGWSLRSYSKYNPTAVKMFIEEINLQGLARREASKYLD